MQEDLAKKLNKLKDLTAKNKIKFKWQDEALAAVEELNLPRYVQTEKGKKPLDVRAILMRHARENLANFKRRIGLVKEQGKSGDVAFLYYLGIVENENRGESN